MGKFLCDQLIKRGIGAVGAVRSFENCTRPYQVVLGDLGEQPDWSTILSGVHTLIHTAAVAHIPLQQNSPEIHSRLWAVNVESLSEMMLASSLSGVKHVIYLSSVKVYGESTDRAGPFNEESQLLPEDLYGLTKKEAEQRLYRLAKSLGINLTILRVPLIYGPGVKGNIRQLLRWMVRGYPIPVGIPASPRSVLGLYNLCDLIGHILVMPARPLSIFNVADDDSVSFGDMITWLAEGLGLKPRKIPLPSPFLDVGFALLGKREISQRLTRSLVIDSRRVREHLNWTAPNETRVGLIETGAWFDRSSS